MSIARSLLLLSAGATFGITGWMVLTGEIDLSQHIEALRSADRSSWHTPPPSERVATSSVPAPSPKLAERAPETVIVTVPGTPAPGAPSRPPSAAGDRLSLAQELHSELQRVGCYAGSVDGNWTPLSQRAMKAFLDGVNAHLPVQEPDYAHLALIRGYKGTACARPCSLSADAVCAIARPLPERAPAALARPIASGPAAPTEARLLPAGQVIGGTPGSAAAAPQAPAQVALTPGVQPGAPQQKRKASPQQQSSGVFETPLFKLFLY